MPMDWVWGLIGGLMIGAAASIYLLVNGRIMGASGILGGLLDGSGEGRAERLAFIAGVIGAPAIVALVHYSPDTKVTNNLAVIVLGGLLVGIGTRMANGCTSGHGVCGMSRFSLRGIAASAVYVGFGMAAMTVLRHGLGWI
ncbi:MAG: YeeE/YedE thiosulfate transporter family protein [Pseudomonadota bacterium]